MIQTSEKTALTSWIILVLIAVLLWYRNNKYDRVLSIFIFALGLVQLIEFGIYDGANPNQAGKTIFLLLWLECLVLAIGVFVFISNNRSDTVLNTLATWNLIIFAVVFSVALLIFLLNGQQFIARNNGTGQIELTRTNGQLFLGNFTWLYILGIFLPLILIFYYYSWADYGIAILILYGLLSMAYVMVNYPTNQFNMTWTYLLIGFAFLAWFVGMFKTSTN